jgi:hypothetical protein
MDIFSLLREQIRDAHEWVEATMADVTAEQARWIPQGVANPLGATYAHMVVAEDNIVNGLLRGSAPLQAGDWAGMTGVSQMMPMPGPDWPHYPAWTRSVQVDLPALKKYAQAVYAATDQYLASLTPADLDRMVDFGPVGLGQRPVSYVVSRLVLAHADDCCGEIAVLKGLQGAKGYPM